MTTNTTAAATFEANRTEALAKLEAIRKAIEEYQWSETTPEAGINWSHAGEMERNNHQLTDLADRLAGTGEYAE